MYQELYKALDQLIEKGIARGEKKVNNPAYRRMLNGKGHIIYVLANKEELGGRHVDKQLTEEQFLHMKRSGEATRHYDSAPTFDEIKDHFQEVDFLTPEHISQLERQLQRMKFFEKSIKYAKATNNEKMLDGHMRSYNRIKNSLDQIVLNAFNRNELNVEIDEYFITDFKDKFREIGCTFYVSGQDNEHNMDYINNEWGQFKFKKLLTDVYGVIKNQQEKLEEQEVNGSTFTPKVSIQFRSNKFIIDILNEASPTTDAFGFKTIPTCNISRTFSGTGDNKSVYHSLFTAGNGNTSTNEINMVRGGFAKNLMKCFYEQYKNSGVERVSVDAALTSYKPFCGANTWGRWGFRTNEMGNLLRSYKTNFSSKKSVKTDEIVVEHANRDDIFIVKDNNNGTFSKIKIQAGEFILDPKTGRKKIVEIVTKKNQNTNTYKSKVVTYYDILPSDVDEMARIYEANKVEGQPFRIQHFYEAMNNNIVRGIMGTESWHGSVYLKDEEQKKDYERNLYKEYKRIPDAVYEYFKETDKDYKGKDGVKEV